MYRDWHTGPTNEWKALYRKRSDQGVPVERFAVHSWGSSCRPGTSVVPSTLVRHRPLALISPHRPLPPIPTELPLRERHAPSVALHRFEQLEAGGAEGVGEEQAAAGGEVGVEDGAQRRMEALRVEDVGAEDEVVVLCVRPPGPVGETVLDRADAVAFRVGPPQREHAVVAIGLEDARAVGRRDDSRQTGPRPELQHPLAGELARARRKLVREGDRRRPEGKSVWRLVTLLAQQALLVLIAERRACMGDRPLVRAESEMVLVQWANVRQRHQSLDDVFRGSQLRVAAARTIPSARSTIRASPVWSMRDATSVARW